MTDLRSAVTLATPHHRREGRVFHWPSDQGQVIEALSRRRSRQPKGCPISDHAGSYDIASAEWVLV
jgi:hypothetical protein